MSSIKDHFSSDSVAIGKQMPSFIKPAPPLPPTASATTIPKKIGIALDSLEPVIMAGVSSSSHMSIAGATTPNPNIPSPQNFASSQKGIDLLQGGDILQPRGSPQFVGLTKITYQGSNLQLAQSGSIEVCTSDDFNECFIEKTLSYYYKVGEGKASAERKSQKLNASNLDSRGDSSSPERTGKMKQRHHAGVNEQINTSGGSRHKPALDKSGYKDERKATSYLLQQAKRTPYDFCKLSFTINLPYEMQIEQIQFQLPPHSNKPSEDSSVVQQVPTTGADSVPKQSQQTKQRGNAMNIISTQNSHGGSQDTSITDYSFSANFKILNISSVRSPELVGPHGQSTESRQRNHSSRKAREHKHIAVKSAFSEEVTGKNTIEVNLCAVTKHLHVTLLCLKQDIGTILQQWKQQSQNSSKKFKTSAFDSSKQQPVVQAPAKNLKISGAQRLIAEIEDFDILDEHDQEVAFISKQHYNTKGGNDSEIIDHDQIGLQLRGDDDGEFDRDFYGAELSNFKVGNIMNNDEDDLRILDSLPQAIKPKALQNSFNSKKETSVQKQKQINKLDEQSLTTGGPLGRFIDKIVVYGFNCNSIPAITNLTYFMNQSLFMRKNKKYQQAEEIEYLVGTLMITTKRATQAGEFFRKMEASCINKIKRYIARPEMQGRVSAEDYSSQNETFQLDQELRNETQNLFIQCALFELIIADGFSFETQLNEKIQALNRLVTFTEGQLPQPIKFAPQVLVSNDSFSALLRILPQLLRFCILSMTHRREIVRMSALKILKFILETQGCSLDTSMIYILKGMFLTFPKATTTQKQQTEKEEKLKRQLQSLDDSPEAKSISTQKALEEPDSATLKNKNDSKNEIRIIKDEFDLAMLVGESEAATMTIADYVFCGQSRSSAFLNNSANAVMIQNVSDSHVIAVEPVASLYATKYKEIQEPTSGFSTALQNVHQHVLETYISVLSSISSHILHRIFYDVIEDALCPTPLEQYQKSSAKHSASFKQSNSNNVSVAAREQARALMAQASQIKVYACKIAEKIITICQGDLNISAHLLNSLVDAFSSSKLPMPIDGASNQAHASMKNLWNSIKLKVFPNYSTKGYRKLIEWINFKLYYLLTAPKTVPQDLLNTKPVNQRKDAFPDELSDEETTTLCQICDIITIVTFNRLKQEEEANQLIKLPTAESFGNGASAEMYLLLPQLIFWLEYSIDREDRLQLFTQLYQTVKEVMDSVPTNGRSREHQLSIVQIVMPSLRRTNEFLQSNSPSLPMLKFLEITLNDLQLCAHDRKSKQQNLQLSPTSAQEVRDKLEINSIADPLKLQGFFLEMLENFVKSVAYSLYEEAFIVFDKLLYLAGETITEMVIKKCIVALVDKYTLKSKAHKTSLAAFMKTLMDVKVRRNMSSNTSRAPRKLSNPGSPEFEDLANENDLSGLGQAGSYFEVMAEFCFFENVDTNYKVWSREGTARMIDDKTEHNVLGMPQLDFRGPIDMHELFIDKLQFFIDSLALMTEAHIGMFTYLITNHNFKTMLLQILEHGETNVRMKTHEILEALTSYFVQCCPSKTVYEFPGGAREQNLLPDGSKKMEAEFIAHERLYISQIVIQVAKKSLQQSHDCYLQFNALILLDFLFQNLLPVPTFQNEQVKARKQNRRATMQSPSAEPAEVELTMDIEVLSISDMTPELDVMDPAYLRMRMKLVLSLWPHIQAALASPWSNIRSICYGLVCSMLKINVQDYQMTSDQQALSREIGHGDLAGQSLPQTSQIINDRMLNNNLSDIISDHQAALSEDRNKDQLSSDLMSINVVSQARLKEIVLPMLYSLLNSKESESKAGGLNILGSFCGLSYDFTGIKINQNLAFLQRNSQFISLPIWRLVYQLQDDWDITIKEASVVLVQLCAPRNAIQYFQSLKEKRQQRKLQYLMNQMPNVQSIYVKKNQADGEVVKGLRPESKLKIKNHLIRRNEHAARAYARFPTDNDIDVILGRLNYSKSAKPNCEQEASFSILQESTTLVGLGDHFGNFADYLSGKIPIMTPIGEAKAHELLFSHQAISCQMIEQENIILSDKVHAFDPDFEDTRFAKNLSRKRQLEIELDMPKRGRKNTALLNFFVDTYSDEQIQEIISIFRNDFKPPKNLWIEKQPSPQSLVSGGMSNGALMAQAQQPNMRSQSPDYYQDIYVEAIEQFNQQQAQMQQQQQAQLQQQVQSGQTISSASRESSALSNQSSASLGQGEIASMSASVTQPLFIIKGESAASTAARHSPQPSGRMIDAVEDDQLRKYAEEQQAKLSSHNSSASSNKSSQKHSHHGSIEEKINTFGEVLNNADANTIESRNAIYQSKDKQGSGGGGIWSPDTQVINSNGHQANGPQISSYTDESPHGAFLEHLRVEEKSKAPYKSESMGLLDAEGYKFLEASDSNSDESHTLDDQENNFDGQEPKRQRRANQPKSDFLYEMRPPVQKQRARKLVPQAMKIEQLNFENIQIYGQEAHQQPPKQIKKKLPPTDRLQKKVVKSPQNYQPLPNLQDHYNFVPQGARIEFYQEPAEHHLPQTSSRLGQRSSRLQIQDEMKNYSQQQQKPDEEGTYIISQKLLNKLKSPTDKIAGGTKAPFKTFNEIEGREQKKSNEQRKRKRTSGPNLGQNQLKLRDGKKQSYPGHGIVPGKPQHLQLIENDYFSSDDKNVSHLRNLTQKAVHSNQGGLGSWSWATNPAQVCLEGQQTTRNRAKSIGNPNSISTPDFSMMQIKLGQKHTQNQNSIGIHEGAPEATTPQELIDQNKISRKMAQTYLSGLSKGFISKMDNLKLINTCLHQDTQILASTAAGSTQGAALTNKAASSMLLNKSLTSGPSSTQRQQVKKIINKSFENLAGNLKLKQSSNQGGLLVFDLQLPKTQMAIHNNQTQCSQKGVGKNSTLSSSPKRRDGSNTGSGSHQQHRKQKHSIEKGIGVAVKKGKFLKDQLHTQRQPISDSKGLSPGVLLPPGGSGQSKKVNTKNISDLHLFIKTIEKDLTEQFPRGCGMHEINPATPNQIRRQVEDQMRLFGLDPKSGNNKAAAQALALKFGQTDQGSSGQHSQEKKRKKSMPPKLNLMGLNPLFQGTGLANQELNSALFNQNAATPSYLSGSHQFMAKSHLNIHTANQFQGSPKKYSEGERRSSGSRPRKRSNTRDRSGESHRSTQRNKSGRLSTGRGASSGSGGRGNVKISHQVPHAPMVMTERCMRPLRPATGGKSSQEKTHTKNSKSFTKGYGSALAKINKPTLHKIIKQQTFSPKNQVSSSLQPQFLPSENPIKASSKPSQKLNMSHNKGSNSAMNQIVTSRQADKHSLQHIINVGAGSVSVRNSDYNSGVKTKGGGTQITSPFFINKKSQHKMTPASAAKGSQLTLPKEQ